MAEHTIYYMNGQQTTLSGDITPQEVQELFGIEGEVILKQDNLTFVVRKDHDTQPRNPRHPTVGGPLIMIADSESW